MARKKRNINLPSVIKFGIVGFLALVISTGLFKGGTHLLQQSPYFRVKLVVVDPGLSFISQRDRSKLKNVNIFLVNIRKIQKRLSRKYPQVRKLKVVRRFPNQIHILAEQRKPFAQTEVKNKTLTLADDGVVLSTTSQQNDKVPFIKGIHNKEKRVLLGHRLPGIEIKIALKILQAFDHYRALDAYGVKTIDVTNISKIEFILSNDLKVLMDKDNINHKVKLLSVVLARGQLNLDEIRYLDLRFKEPIIGKK